MRTLLLLRHAKSDQYTRVRADQDRPLNQRGRRAAGLMAAHMARRGLVPDFILCSSATRARQTLDLMTPNLGGAIPADYRDDLYLADSTTILRVVNSLCDGAATALVVGHNPGLHGLAVLLGATSGGGAVPAIQHKFPTCALAAFEFDIQNWRRAEPDRSRFIHYTSPKLVASQARKDAAM